MKTKSYIAALILAAAVLSPASAAPILLTATFTAGAQGNPLSINLSGSGNGYIVATGYDNGLGGALPPGPGKSVTINESAGYQTAVGVNSSGLGLANNGDQIGPDEYVVLDFSNVAKSTGTPSQPENSVSLNFNIDARPGTSNVSYWVVYGIGNGGTTTWLGSGDMQTSPAVEKVVTTALYNSYVIGINGDCEINLTGVTVQYSAPEPGTLLMSGMALVGLGVAIKKRSRKA